MGGLKSLAAVVLIKIKIVLVLAAIVAVVVFTIKYLLGAAHGIPDVPGLLYYKGNNVIPLPPLPQHPPPPPLPLPPPPAPVPYLPDVHESVYGYDQGAPSPWDHPSSHDTYGHNDWSKIGDGGRSFIDITSLYPSLEKILPYRPYNFRRKRKRRSYLNLDVFYNHK